MRKHALAGAGVGLLSALAMVMGPATASGAEGGKLDSVRDRSAATAPDCGSTAGDKDHSTYPKPFDGTTNIRSGPSTGCGVVTQVGSTNKADYHCFDVGSDGKTWTFMRVKHTAYGWVRDDVLRDGGSNKVC
ncbi:MULTISPECIES: hypothetical protein [Prauserella salsuginis group]|uniref:SH3 domain-containing protein n=2 Tax=Prauserella salsuginis group TaxID=2893672 RepID=A0A839XUQ5_9PSEU|nr:MULTISPECIES: hypothetical protein [Prauserella salsuginis group]MBB3663555.1 hypothetical protein [Prauserella sediminis]MCR3720626.1 hypothetical protein [Prauserella flava]MCR3735293.1 hypothetical protein [Prauserella salsuginis]